MLLALFIIVLGGAVVSCSEEVDQLTEANFGSKDFDIKIHSTSLEAGDEIVMNIEAKTAKAKGHHILMFLNVVCLRPEYTGFRFSVTLFLWMILSVAWPIRF